VHFTSRGARSPEFVAVLGIAVAAETLVLHVLLFPSRPVLAVALTVLSVSSLAWLARDYVLLGRPTVRVAGDTLELSVGLRVAASVPLADLRAGPAGEGGGPSAGAPNVTKPAPPNVTFTFSRPVAARFFGLPRPISAVSLHVDDPDGLFAALGYPPRP
jgi:hypothetical protein